MDRYLIAGALLLLSFETSWLMHDLKIVNIPVFNQGERLSETKPIGRVLATKQDLRRRPVDSIVWEESRANDTLFFYDTVLTLDQSAATIQLNDTGEISLSENTLVVLEPVDKTQSDQLRVKFTRGQLHSRNLASTTVITSPTWTLQAEKGADVKLRSTGDGQMEVELLKGKVELKNDKETLSFKDEQVILLHKEQAESIPISETLTWDSGKDNIYRVYSHSFPTTAWLKWKGQAQRLRLIKPGNDQSVYPVSGDRFPLQLEPGLYQVRLEGKKESSPTLAVQVWKAPAFHLLSPLPRSRFVSGVDTTFTWSTAGLISKYRFELGRDEKFDDVVRAIASEGSIANTQMPEQGQYYWRVQALDDLDFPIPSLDTNVIFSVKDPLQAPKLRAPETRAPANDKSSSLDLEKLPGFGREKFDWKRLTQVDWKHTLEFVAGLLIPRAEAREEFFEAVFSWDEVEDADYYYVEIDSNPDFHKPIVVQKTKKPEFVWPKASVGVYFWRVAAGSDDRMGLFSEAAQVRLQTPSVVAKEVAPGVQVRKIKSAIPEAPVVAVLEKPEPTPVPTPEPPAIRRPVHFSVTYGLGYDFSLLSGEDSATANLSGVAPLRLGFAIEIPVGREASMWNDFLYSRALWKPKSAAETPFQSQLTDQTLRGHFHYKPSSEGFHYGLYASSTSNLKRSGLESVQLENVTLVGPAFGIDWLEFERITFSHLVSLSFGNGMVELATMHRGLRRIQLNDEASLLLGGDFDLTFQRHTNGSNYRFQIGVSAGVAW